MPMPPTPLSALIAALAFIVAIIPRPALSDDGGLADRNYCEDPRLPFVLHGKTELPTCLHERVSVREEGVSTPAILVQVYVGEQGKVDRRPHYRNFLIDARDQVEEINELPLSPSKVVLQQIAQFLDFDAEKAGACCGLDFDVLYQITLEKVSGTHCLIVDAMAPFSGRLEYCTANATKPKGTIQYSKGMTTWEKAIEEICRGGYCRSEFRRNVLVNFFRRDSEGNPYYLILLGPLPSDEEPVRGYPYLLYRVDALTGAAHFIRDSKKRPDRNDLLTEDFPRIPKRYSHHTRYFRLDISHPQGSVTTHDIACVPSDNGYYPALEWDRIVYRPLPAALDLGDGRYMITPNICQARLHYEVEKTFVKELAPGYVPLIIDTKSDDRFTLKFIEGKKYAISISDSDNIPDDFESILDLAEETRYNECFAAWFKMPDSAYDGDQIELQFNVDLLESDSPSWRMITPRIASSMIGFGVPPGPAPNGSRNQYRHDPSLAIDVTTAHGNPGELIYEKSDNCTAATYPGREVERGKTYRSVLRLKKRK